MQPDFWLQRWQTHQIGFHRDTPLPLLLKHWPELGLETGSQVFVPLCGKSLDMLWLAEQGHRILGVELSQLAITQFFDERGLSPKTKQSPFGTHYCADAWEIICGDAFTLSPEILQYCAGVYDRGAMIALPPKMRETYIATAWSRLPVGCQGLLVTLEYPQAEKNGPPFSVEETEVRQQFADIYTVELLERRNILKNEPKFQAEGITALHTSIYRILRHNAFLPQEENVPTRGG